jgi:hypothetical protein
MLMDDFVDTACGSDDLSAVSLRTIKWRFGGEELAAEECDKDERIIMKRKEMWKCIIGAVLTLVEWEE